MALRGASASRCCATSWISERHSPVQRALGRRLPVSRQARKEGGAILDGNAGGADENLDCFYAASPRLTRYSMGLREPRDNLIRFSLYQRMYESTASMNCSMVALFQSRA